MTCVAELSPSLQRLIDARLDSIERILLSTDVNRIERREIVQAVEDQVYELLDRRNEVEATREGILAVLSEIDPPEAYVSEGYDIERRPSMPRGPAPGSPVPSRQVTRTSPLAIIALVLGIISFPTATLIPISVVFGLAAIVCGSISLTQIQYSKPLLKGMWLSIVGITLPVIAWMILLFLFMMM